MKAYYLTGLEKMEAGEAPMPKYGPDDVLIKMEAVGICGSDLHYYAAGAIGDFKVKFRSSSAMRRQAPSWRSAAA